jgi:hypothetical protein
MLWLIIVLLVMCVTPTLSSCWDGGDLLLCDFCPVAVHAKCVGLDADEVKDLRKWWVRVWGLAGVVGMRAAVAAGDCRQA